MSKTEVVNPVPGEVSTAPAVAEKKFLGVEDMLSTPNVYYRDVPAFGGTVRLASLNAEELIEFLSANDNPEQKRRASVRMVVRGLVNEAGERIGKPEHVDLFLKKDSGNVNRLIRAMMELTGLSDEESKEAKNSSGGAGSAASPTS
jgi:hypothetical protein